MTDSVEALQAQIAALQAQLAEAEKAEAKAKAPAPAPARFQSQASPVPAVEDQEESTPAPSSEQQPASQNQPAPPVAVDEPDNTIIKVGVKGKADWNRPKWASQMEIEDDRAVNSDSIKTNLRQQTDGYQRKVKAEALVIQKGTFVKPQGEKKPPPRLTWVVGRINGKGVPGKVVMHLYGKDVDKLVDQFEELKNKVVTVGGPQKAALTVDSDPPFHITLKGAANLNSQAGVFGVVQEGHGIVNKLTDAGSDGAELSIKQAHIYPVKKSKGSYM